MAAVSVCLLPVRAQALFGIKTNKIQNDIITRLESSYSQKNYNDVEELGREFLIKYPSASAKKLKKVYMLLGRSYEAEKQYDKAMLVYNEAAEFLPKDTDVHLALADIYLNGGLTENAKTVYDKVLKFDKDNKAAILGLAKSYYEEGFFSRACTYFKQYNDSGAQEPADFLYYYAMAEYLSNHNDTALKIAYSSLIKKNDADGYLLLAKIYKNKKDWENSLKYLDKALEKEPSRKDIYLTKTLWLAFNVKTYAQGLKMAEDFLKQYPSDKLALFAKYIALFRAGETKKAQEQLMLINSFEDDSFIERLSLKLYQKTAE